MTGLRLVFFTILLVATAVFYLGGELSRYPVSLRVVFVTIGVVVRPRRPLRRHPSDGEATSSRSRTPRSSSTRSPGRPSST